MYTLLMRIAYNIFPIIAIYFSLISLIAIVVTICDKRAAIRHKRRVSEKALFFLALIGGAAGMFMTMLLIRHKTKHKRFMLGLPIIIIVQLFMLIVPFDMSIQTTFHTIESDKIANPVRLMLVTDNHSCDYGKEQIDLVKAIDKQKPDVILLGGDIFDDKKYQANSTKLVEILSSKYPCYYVSGNHEFWSRRADDFKDILIKNEVTVLEGATDTIQINGETIAISGVDDPDTDRYPSRAVPYKKQLEQLSESIDSNVFNVLLSHRPERIEELLPLKTDLVLSGHAHGGQWRLPFVLENGLLAPDQGMFPKYGNGMRDFKDTKFIVSRGLARETTSVPRIFNRPELVVIDVK